ncbi:8160_t:CDS:2, partial [Racocetra persica]
LLYSLSQMSNLFLVRAEAITKLSILCDVGGRLSPTILTMNLLVIFIFAFDAIWKNVLKTESQSFRNFILWSTIFAISWAASTFGLNRYDPLELCNLLIIFKLENDSVTFFSALLLIGAHSGGILNSILLSIKQYCDMDLDDEIIDIEKNDDLTILDKSITTKSYGTMRD